jgi:hypothetical protein
MNGEKLLCLRSGFRCQQQRLGLRIFENLEVKNSIQTVKL